MSKKKKIKPEVQNFVHKYMVEQHKCVAMKSEKDYDRRKSKQQLKLNNYGDY